MTPEQWLDQYVRDDKNWSKWHLWTYGRRHDMLRELHAAVHVNGKLVTREFVAGMNRRGEANVSLSYAHSYLIHAYRSAGTQDVKLDQVQRRAYREHNPNWMLREDRLQPGER